MSWTRTVTFDSVIGAPEAEKSTLKVAEPDENPQPTSTWGLSALLAGELPGSSSM
jgi:hypothetical protein